jgi:hypothetical protein
MFVIAFTPYIHTGVAWALRPQSFQFCRTFRVRVFGVGCYVVVGTMWCCVVQGYKAWCFWGWSILMCLPPLWGGTGWWPLLCDVCGVGLLVCMASRAVGLLCVVSCEEN